MSEECFDVSLIIDNATTAVDTMLKCLFENFGLIKGEERHCEFFGDETTVLISYIGGEEWKFGRVYEEILISFRGFVFHKDKFEKEIARFTALADICFTQCPELHYVVCSYESNGYYLDGVKALSDFTDEVLRRFPLSYRRDGEGKPALMMLDLRVQDISLQ